MGERIRAAVVDSAGSGPVICDVDLADLLHDEILVRIAATGVCHTDVAWAAGEVFRDFPVVLGHESAGTVEAVGSSVTRVRPGDRVALALAHHCGHCAHCESGHPMLCGQRLASRPRLFRDGRPLVQGFGTGGFATATVVRDVTAVPVPEGVPLEVAAIAGCAVSTGLGAVMNIARVIPGSTVAVLGCGGIGLNVVMGARLAGAGRIVAVDGSELRRETAVRVGATDAVEPDEAAVSALAPDGYDYVFECVGSVAVMAAAVRLVRRGGDVVLIGATAPEATVAIPALDLVGNQKHIHGCLTGDIRPDIDLPRYFDWYRRGRLDLDALVSASVGLDDIAGGLARSASNEGIRTLVTMG